jgi:hypothetical protein
MLPVTFENATFLLQFWQAVDGSGNNCMGQGASAGGGVQQPANTNV